ncbi:diacylglycerol/lipid kinase family protein [Patescibacteria group bacterium]
MYYYIYDSFLSDRKNRRRVAAVETSLTDLGISGERERVTPIRQVSDLVQVGLEREVKTIVLVGNDYTFTKALNAAAKEGFDPAQVAFGIIPFGEPNKVGKLLGIENDTDAPRKLAARKMQTLDIGQVNQRFFITSIEVGFEPEHKTRKDVVQEKLSSMMVARRLKKFKPKLVKVILDKQVQVSCELFNLSVINVPENTGITGEAGKLKVCVVPFTEDLKKKASLIARRQYDKLPHASVFAAADIEIEGPRSMKIATDGVLYDNLPVKVSIIPDALRVIVGRGRKV